MIRGMPQLKHLEIKSEGATGSQITALGATCLQVPFWMINGIS